MQEKKKSVNWQKRLISIESSIIISRIEQLDARFVI
jgi:hypothetical protein